MASRCRPFLMLAAALLVSLSGCALSSKNPADTFDTAPAEPQPTTSTKSTRALLLDTGAIQLGPGLGKNAYRWMGDGQWGF
jgi:ABC-type uncharacterized transport system auxiliary subunit